MSKSNYRPVFIGHRGRFETFDEKLVTHRPQGQPDFMPILLHLFAEFENSLETDSTFESLSSQPYAVTEAQFGTMLTGLAIRGLLEATNDGGKLRLTEKGMRLAASMAAMEKSPRGTKLNLDSVLRNPKVS